MQCETFQFASSLLDGLNTVRKAKWNAILINQKSALLLNKWSRTVVKTMTNASKFHRISTTNCFVFVTVLL